MKTTETPETGIPEHIERELAGLGRTARDLYEAGTGTVGSFLKNYTEDGERTLGNLSEAVGQTGANYILRISAMPGEKPDPFGVIGGLIASAVASGYAFAVWEREFKNKAKDEAGQ